MKSKGFYTNREMMIVINHSWGWSYAVIAAIFEITPRRVRQILRDATRSGRYQKILKRDEAARNMNWKELVTL